MSDILQVISEQLVGENVVYIARLPAALLTLLIAHVALRLIKQAIRTGARLAHLDPTVKTMLLSIVGFVWWVLALAMALSVMHLNQLSLALGGSVALVAMAMATGLNSITQDLMAGIFLLSDKNFHVGTRVKAGGIEGVVESVTIRKTYIRAEDGGLHAVPNRNIDLNTYVIFQADQTESRGKAG